MTDVGFVSVEIPPPTSEPHAHELDWTATITTYADDRTQLAQHSVPLVADGVFDLSDAVVRALREVLGSDYAWRNRDIPSFEDDVVAVEFVEVWRE